MSIIDKKSQSEFRILTFLIIAFITSVVLLWFQYQQIETQNYQSTQRMVERINELIDQLNDVKNEYNYIKQILAISDDVLKNLTSGQRLVQTLHFVEVVWIDNETQGIIVKNTGDTPLTDFKVYLNNEQLTSLTKIGILYPGDSGIIVLPLDDWKRFHDAVCCLKITTIQGVEVQLGASKLGKFVTGYFVKIEK